MKDVLTYAAVNKDSGVRSKSSSGAVFYELARWVIANGGVVYGARFADDWSVIHDHTSTIEGVNAFLGSKYVQSEIGKEYISAKNDLEDGKTVLFSGTPCQIAGLKSFLRKSYDRLITVDFICHGVPSPGVWEKYLQMISKGRTISGITFRDKTEGWMRYSLKINFTDGGSYRKTQQNDLFLQGFLQDIYLRPSCYSCRFKGIDRDSDVTLADFWSVRKLCPSMFDDNGTSLIILHSEQGKRLWRNIRHNFEAEEIKKNDLHVYGSSLTASAVLTPKRIQFYSEREPDFKLLRRLTRKPVKQRLNITFRRAAKKLKKICRRKEMKYYGGYSN